MRKRTHLLSLLLCFSTGAIAATAGDQKFTAITDREATWRAADDGLSVGFPPPHLEDVRPEAQARRLDYLEQIRTDLVAIDPATLSPSVAVDYAVYRFDIDSRIASLKSRDFEMPANSDSSFWSYFAIVPRFPFKTEADYRSWLNELHELPAYFDAQIANMRAGERRGFTPPRVTLAGREEPVAQIANATNVEETPLYLPFKAMPVEIPAATQTAMRAEARAVIEQQDLPAYHILLTYLRSEYIPYARTTLAAEALPNGRAWYAEKIREFTTLDLTPDQIHQVGLDAVASIHAEMLEAMKQAGFQGDLPAFLKFLRTDPRFYVTTPQALLDRAAWTAKLVDAKVGHFIGHLPRQRFAIEPVAPDIAPFFTAGRGSAGMYSLNTYDLPSRPLYQLPALTLHESAPGHAFQMPLADENKDTPSFRKIISFNAYEEGWALYCERLGDEMGIYQTPYERFGMLSYQMWRASRLVIDTGIHHLGWTREQAVAYLQDNTALSDHEIQTEVDRYISWPGQALAYYLGEMTIRNGRAKAEAALGPRFNIRAFHDTVLSLGSVPMPVLSERIDHFIAGGGKGPYPDEE